MTRIPDVNAASVTSPAAVPDEALLRRVQQENHRQIVGKLMHDLRNPVHSMRIIMELFGRLARREGDIEMLIQRAATFIAPAQAAMDSLLITTERLGTYLSNPAAPVIVPLSVSAWIEEIAFLLRASRKAMQVTVSVEADPAVRILADRPRLSHAALLCCLRTESPRAALCVRERDAAVHIAMSFATAEPRPSSRGDSSPFSAEELSELVGNAGGTFACAEDGGVSMSFSRSAG